MGDSTPHKRISGYRAPLTPRLARPRAAFIVAWLTCDYYHKAFKLVEQATKIEYPNPKSEIS
jgi:hypothetical protein